MTQEDFNAKFMQGLNNQQKEAVLAVNGAILLLAVPGSGKTRVLVTRLGYMICCKNINPANIITMTYTKAATKEMKQRFAYMFGEDIARNLEFNTINALSLKIINYYAANHSKGNPFELISSDGEITKIIREIYININKDYPTDSTVKDVKTCITYIKNMMLNSDEIAQLKTDIKNIGAIYKAYCDFLVKNKKMDFDDQMQYALEFLKKVPPVLEYFQNKYKYICVDESQDTSKIQHEIIKKLASKHNNIFMVGDEDQSIYGFRAAYPQALMNFDKDYKDTKTLLMEHNYRSKKDIIACANAFVAQNKFRHEKVIKATLGKGEPVHFINAVNRRAQYKYLFCKAKKAEEEIAVLYRLNDSALPLIDMLEVENIPYNCRSFEETFFTNKIIIDIVDIINFAHSPYDTEIFMRIYYKFAGQFTKKSAEYACAMSRKYNTEILEELLKAPDMSSYKKEDVRELIDNFPKIVSGNAEQALNCLWNNLGYVSFVKDRNLDEGKFFTLCLLAEGKATAKSLLDRLAQLKDIIQNHKNSSETKLTLSTIHSSKGLEYNSVYVLDALNGILPSSTVAELVTDEDKELYEEERRLYYVAITRAKNKLSVFNCKRENSAFNAEIMRSCPKAIIDEKDVFASLSQDLCGKTYKHKTKGKGIVTAQNGNDILIEYISGDVQLLNFGEMLINRDESVTYEIQKPTSTLEFGKQNNVNTQNNASNQNKKAKPPVKSIVNIGAKVEHIVFGIGVITRVSGSVISVRFEKDGKIKSLDLGVCLKSDLLRLINE